MLLNIYEIFILSFKMYYNIIQPRTLFPSKVEGQTLELARTFCYLIGRITVTSPHNRSHFAPYKSHFAPYRSYFAPSKKLVKFVVNFSF